MAIDPKFTAALALHRFGFGPVPGAIAAIADDPRGALLAELERPSAGQVAAANLPNSAQAGRAFAEYRAERLAQQKLLQRAKQQAPAGGGDTTAMKPEGDEQARGAQATNNGQNRPPELPALLVQNEAKFASRRRSRRQPDSSSAWSGFGRITFAFRPTFPCRWRAPMNARPYGRTSLAASSTC